MKQEIRAYNDALSENDRAICNAMAKEIDRSLPKAENKIWHAHPVWFLDGNPIVGYSKQKAGIRLMSWRAADSEEEELKVKGKKFKDASVFYNSASEIKTGDLKRWLGKAESIQWDYAKIVEELRPRAEKSVRRALLLEAIAEKEAVDASDADVDAEVEKFARASQRPVPAVRRMMEKSGDLDAVRHGLRDRKMLDLLIEHARVTA